MAEPTNKRRHDFVMDKLSISNPEFVRNVKAASDRGEPLYSEQEIYDMYEDSRSVFGKVADFLEIPENFVAKAIYETNPEHYDAIKAEPSEEMGIKGALLAVGSVIASGSLLVPKMGFIGAALTGAGLVTSAGIMAAAGKGILGMPKEDRWDEAWDSLSETWDDLSKDPWERQNELITFRELMPDSPNMSMFLGVAMPDPVFDLGAPVGWKIGSKVLGRGAKEAVRIGADGTEEVVKLTDKVPSTKEMFKETGKAAVEEGAPLIEESAEYKLLISEGVGPQEARHEIEKAAREGISSRRKEGKRIIKEYFALPVGKTVKGGRKPLKKKKALEAFRGDIALDTSRRLSISSEGMPQFKFKEYAPFKANMKPEEIKKLMAHRGKLVKEYVDLYKGAPPEEIDLAYLLGHRMKKNVIDEGNMNAYDPTGTVGKSSFLGTDVVRYTEAIFGRISNFMDDFIVPTMNGVIEAIKKTSMQRKQFEEIAKAAGVRTLKWGGKSIKSSKQIAGEEINIKIFEAVDSGNLEELLPAQRELAYYLINHYEEALDTTNKILRSLDKPEIGTSYIRKAEDGTEVRLPGNYLPRIWAMNWLDEIFDGFRNIPDDVLRNIDDVATSSKSIDELGAGVEELVKGSGKKVTDRALPWAAFMQKRTGQGKDYLKDVAETFDDYNDKINRMKYASYPAELTFRAIDQLAKAGKIDIPTATYYKDWLSTGVMSKRATIDKALFPQGRPMVARAVDKLVSNMSRNLLSGSLQFFMTNLASFPQYVAGAGAGTTAQALWQSKGELMKGLPTVLRGLGATANEGTMSFARKYSQTLQVREITKYENQGRKILSENNIFSAWEGIIESADHFNVAWGFNTGYIHGRKMGMGFEDAVKHGDEWASRTQAIYDRAFVSPVLRNKIVQTAIPFQTFTTNLFQWFTRDIARGGLRGTWKDPVTGAQMMEKEWSTAKKLGIATRFLGTAYAINLTYKALGLKGPWDLKSVIPFAPLISTVTGEAFDAPYGSKEMQFTFVQPMQKIWTGVWAEDYDMQDPDFRKLGEGALMLQPWGFGLQLGRSLTGLYDVAEGSAIIPNKRGRKIRKTLSDRDKAMSILLGPRKTDAWKKVRGEFDPQPSTIQTADKILFPQSFPPYQDD